MDVEFKHLSGSRSGAVETVRGLPIKLGRGPECQVRFDPEVDRKVSVTHAELRQGDDGGIVVMDLDSKNGVLVNGSKLDGPTALSDNAVVQLGEGGPRLQVHFDVHGGVSFARVRADTNLKLEKDKVLRNLASTDEHLPAYKPPENEHSFDLHGPKSPPSLLDNKPLWLGVVVVTACVAVILIGALVFRG